MNAFLFLCVVGIPESRLVYGGGWGNGDAFAGRLEAKLISAILNDANLGWRKGNVEW